MFPNFLKLADVIPLRKKGRKDLKENYRPVNLLPTLSKVFEKIMFTQISACFDNFSKNTNAESTQHCLLTMLEKCKKSVDKGKVFHCIISRSFKGIWLSGPWISHSETECLQLYSFSITFSTRLLVKQKTMKIKIENTYNTWIEIMFGVPQDSILGQLLFNIF